MAQLDMAGTRAPEATSAPPGVSVRARDGQRLNGLGMMIQQYLEQNIAEFEDKKKAALRLRCCTSVEVDNGIAVTVSFLGDTILVENGIAAKPDLHMKASYLLLADVLTGKASPFMEVFRGNIKVRAFPRRPIQSMKTLRFLKIPRELLVNTRSSTGGTNPLWTICLMLVGSMSLIWLIDYLSQVFSR